jgi:aryl-alcohol dehydrogenase-like predicted oxidoreductase
MTYGIANRTGPPNESALQQMLSLARRAGVDTIDTARGYGSSEEIVGRLTEGDPAWRVLTKLAADVAEGHATDDVILARAAASVRESCAALRTSRLSGLLLHRAQHRRAAGGAVWDWLRERRQRGEIELLGVSAITPEEALATLDDDDIDVVQVATSLLDQRLIRRGFFDSAANKRVIVRSAYLQGAAHLPVTGLPGHLRALAGPLATIRQWADDHGMPHGAPFMLFLRAMVGVEVVVGAETITQLEQTLEWWDQPVDGRELTALAASVPELPDDVLDPSRWPSG